MSCNNTNSTCSNCSNNYSSCNNKCTKCGCKDSFLTSPPPCPTPQGCPDPIPCQEVLASDCIIYTGPDVLCNGDIVVYNDATWTEVLEQIVEYFCVPPIPEITCNGDIVVTEDSTINEALEDIVSYFCLPLIPEILCGEDIVVTEESSINEALEDIVSYFCDHLTTANNGLTMSPTSYNVQLGGTLLQSTTIQTSTFNLKLEGTSSAPILTVNQLGGATNSVAIKGVSTGGFAGYFEASANAFGAIFADNTGSTPTTVFSQSNGQVVSKFSRSGSNNTGINPILDLYNVCNTGPAIVGLGTSINFNIEDSASIVSYAGNLAFDWTSFTGGNSSRFTLNNLNQGVISTKVEVAGTGQLKLNKYGIGTFTGVPTYNLSTTLGGDIIETTGGLFGTAFRAVLNPPSISTVALTVNNSRIVNGVTIKPTVDYQLVNGVTTVQYDPVTGIWTCPQTGKYDINYNVFLTAPDIITKNGWGDTTNGALVIDPLSPFGFGLNPPGQFFIGVTDNTTTTYCADYCTVINGQPLAHIYLTGGMQGVTLNVGDILVLKVQNMTGISYVALPTPPGGDNIDWAIRRVG